MKYGLGGLACAACGGAAYAAWQRWHEPLLVAEVFKGDAPRGELWQQWLARGWAREARHWLKLGENIQCKLCPNACLLEPEDRGHCRGRVHKDGKLYTLSYNNACTLAIDPVEKKPLYHYLPCTATFSLAATGCGFRCLNCQNWEISQAKPEERKDPSGPESHIEPRRLHALDRNLLQRGSLTVDDVLAFCDFLDIPSISYTYSEPTVWFEYMFDCAQAARGQQRKNICVTCGSIEREPLAELCQVIDAAHVDLKSFDESIYADLNTGRLAPVLDTLQALARAGVWFEIINLIVPTYTDKPEMIRRMCDWLVDRLGPDRPLHFSRFHPQHQLTHLPMTPRDTLLEARDIARQAGLHYVYIGNCLDVDDAGTTYCPHCHKVLITRQAYNVQIEGLQDGRCAGCGTSIAGVWKA